MATATADELWQMAHDLLERARVSIDPTTKRMLIRAADNYLQEATKMRPSHTVIKAKYPKPDRKIG